MAKMVQQKYSCGGLHGRSIPVRQWTPDHASGSPIRAVIHICHGMAEHSARYEGLAAHLADAGFITVAHDHRGHGAGNDSTPGHSGNTGGWHALVDDVGRIQARIHHDYPDLPCFLMGHSMGSFIAQGYLMSRPTPPAPAGLILCGSNLENPMRLRALRLIVALEKKRCGPAGYSPVLRKLTFDTFAAAIPDADTPFDWLSRDPKTIADYLADPACGFQCTTQFWQDLSSGLQQIIRRRSMRRVPSDMPLYIMAGDQDPVGEFGKGPTALAEAYRETGHKAVTLTLYPETRHEPFNDLDRDRIMADLQQWLVKQLKEEPLSRQSAA